MPTTFGVSMHFMVVIALYVGSIKQRQHQYAYYLKGVGAATAETKSKSRPNVLHVWAHTFYGVLLVSTVRGLT